MDARARRFREAARRENAGRRGTAKRYSAELHREAVLYAWARREAGESLSSSARALGLPAENLSRWMKESERRGFRAVTVVPEAGGAEGSGILTTPQGFRVEGLSVEELAALLRALS